MIFNKLAGLNAIPSAKDYAELVALLCDFRFMS